MAERSGANEWSGLLGETRRALANLRAEELEELAARAGQLRDASADGTSSLAERWLGAETPAGVAREYRLLGELLAATDRNLKVLRRLRGSASDSGEGNSRWAR